MESLGGQRLQRVIPGVLRLRQSVINIPCLVHFAEISVSLLHSPHPPLKSNFRGFFLKKGGGEGGVLSLFFKLRFADVNLLFFSFSLCIYMLAF